MCAKVADRLGLPRSWIDAVTMPGFGTSSRTLANALSLMELLKPVQRAWTFVSRVWTS